MKKRIAMGVALLGLVGLLAGGVGARRADCGNCPTCEKNLFDCRKLIEPKCHAECTRQCYIGGSSDIIYCYNSCMYLCRTGAEAKCVAGYKDCYSKVCK